MSGPRPARRALAFTTLAEAVREAERLRQGGYDRAGNWDLGQACDHLAEWLRYPIDGFPRVPWFVPLLRWTVGRWVFRRVIRTGSMPAGNPTVPETVPPPGRGDAEAVERLRRAVERFEGHAGEFHPSPLFGKLSREECAALQRVHCAHHLSFLVPRAAGRPAGDGSTTAPTIPEKA